MPDVNIRPIGEKSPNLVTLIVNNVRKIIIFVHGNKIMARLDGLDTFSLNCHSLNRTQSPSFGKAG
jgi:hypothetical protein